MLDKIKLLIGPAANDDELIELLISQAKSFLLLFCGLDSYDSKYDSLIIRMVIEDFNKRGSEGINSRSFSGVSENYNEDPYSSLVMS
jgi:hypothetical protein